MSTTICLGELCWASIDSTRMIWWKHSSVAFNGGLSRSRTALLKIIPNSSWFESKPVFDSSRTAVPGILIHSPPDKIPGRGLLSHKMVYRVTPFSGTKCNGNPSQEFWTPCVGSAHWPKHPCTLLYRDMSNEQWPQTPEGAPASYLSGWFSPLFGARCCIILQLLNAYLARGSP